MGEKGALDPYLEAARRHGQALEDGDSDTANAAYEAREEVLKQFRATPDRGRCLLTELLVHDDAGVRKSAATHLLPIDESRAIATLEEVAKMPGLVGFDAEMVVREWKAGRLKVS